MLIGEKGGLETMVSSVNKNDLNLAAKTPTCFFASPKAKIKGTLSKEKGYCQVIIAGCFFSSFF